MFLRKLLLSVPLYFCPETKVPKVLHSKGGDDAGVDYFRHYCLFTSPQDIFSLSAHRREKRTHLLQLHCSRLCVDFSSFAVAAYLLTSRVAVRCGRKCRRRVAFSLHIVTIFYKCNHVRKLQPFSQITWCWVCTKNVPRTDLRLLSTELH